jgi:hypothetical protein
MLNLSIGASGFSMIRLRKMMLPICPKRLLVPTRNPRPTRRAVEPTPRIDLFDSTGICSFPVIVPETRMMYGAVCAA